MRCKFFPVLLLLGIFPPSILACLDLGIPPGTPLQWRFELPFRVPTGLRGPAYTHTRAAPPAIGQEAKKRDPWRTVARGPKTRALKAPSPLPRFNSFNPMGAARVLTVDITGHMPWTAWNRSDTIPGELAYPPGLRSDLHWLITTTLLRPVFHPARVSFAETANYLLLIGAPLHEATLGWGQSRVLLDYLLKNIPGIPAGPPPVNPLVRGVDDPETRMLIRWASRELVADDPHAFNPLYARRILALGGEAVPILRACLKSGHPLLRENATSLLAAFEGYDEEILKDLRNIFAGRDAVARNRALEGLIRWGDRETADLLIKAQEGNDRFFSIYALHALGRMGSIQALPVIRRRLSMNPGDRGETWMTAIMALARIGDPDGKSLKELKKIYRFCARLPRSLEAPPAGQQVDTPDRTGDRARLMAQETIIAMALLGDEEARDRFFRILKTPGNGQGAPGGQFRDPALGNIEPFNQILAIEALARMEEAGRKSLREIVTHSRDFVLRGYALDQLLRLGMDGDFVLEVARNPDLPSVLRVQAMEGLSSVEATRKSALEVAAGLVDDYLEHSARKLEGGLPPRRRVEPGGGQSVPAYECLSALKLLGRYRPLSPAKMVKVLRMARKVGDFERLEKPKGQGGIPGRRGQPGQVVDTTLRAFPPLYETAIVEFGRLGRLFTANELIRILQDPGGPGRVEAALALGHFKFQGVADALIEALEDPEPWIRYGAYRSLKKISGETLFVDWLFGSKDRLKEGQRAWLRWRREKASDFPE